MMAKCAAVMAFVGGVTLSAAPIQFSQTDLTSDLPGVAANLDTNLANPWGIAASPTSPFWISDNGTGLSTLYNGAGQPFAPLPQVTIPPPAGGMPPSAPTGVIFNNLAPNFGNSAFLFATEDGTIASWAGGPAAKIQVDNSASGAVYKGLAIDAGKLYAANFNSGQVDVFSSTFTPIAGGFVDPTLPAGYAPFDIENINGLLYVTYALQDAAKHDDVAGAGHGFIDVFDSNGVFQKRLVSNGALDSPWGMAIAPAGFGAFGGDLLVGNFGDGTINAFNPTSGAFIGAIDGLNGNPLVNQGLWGLDFGNGSNGTSTGALYFTAGIPGPGGMIEDHGLFGVIDPVPEPSPFWLMAAGLAIALALRRRVKSDNAL